jgi:hypothetical protein
LAEVVVDSESATRPTIQNAQLALRFDLERGTYGGIDLLDGSVCLQDASWAIGDWSSRDLKTKHDWTTEPVRDELGTGLALVIRSRTPSGPERVLRATVYQGQPFVAMQGGIRNTSGEVVQLKTIYPLADGVAFPDLDKRDNFRIVDGFGGGEPLEWGVKAYTPVHRSHAVASRNNLAVTFGSHETRRSLTLGGLSYADYEKFAEIRQRRRVELSAGTDGEMSLLCYLDLARETEDRAADGSELRLVEGELEEHPHFGRFWSPELSTYAVAKEQVVIEAAGLDPEQRYTLGFSWWNMKKRDGENPRVQSIVLDQGPGTPEHVLLDARKLPRWSNPEKRVAEQAELPVPQEAYASGSMRILIKHVAGNPQVAVSELWLRDGAAAPLLSASPTSIEDSERPRRQFELRMFAQDPVGKRVEPGETYLPTDRFFIDFVTRNPFESLEGYARALSRAQQIELSRYDFPTVCLWYAHEPNYGGGGATNTSVGAVAEAKAIQASGFLNYSRAAVRLVPDTYAKNTHQGWWSDEKFRQHGSTNLGDFPGGQYQEPYETTRKWGQAVTEYGCIPLIYSQTGFRSEDYAEAFPEHMLFNKTHAWQDPNKTIAPDDEKRWAFPWGKAASLWSYDYTDSGFLAHLREVYANFASGGIKGLMFDYPASGWAAGGGMEDKSSTTAAAFRTIFRLPHELLGPQSYVHERNMERGSDVALGVIASQRTENDMDHISPSTVSRSGLRWYKNRVVVNYDADSKNLVKAAARSRDELRSLLTMSYTVTGRLLLANSFTQLTPEIFRDLTRIYPFPSEPLTARPVDAFTSRHPQIYHFRLAPQRHQVVFYNTESDAKATVSVQLAGDTAEGALGLKREKYWHVYDFWNDRYRGIIDGSGVLAQSLRPSEARMLSLHEVADHPQVISSDRHIMQGWLELGEVKWDAENSTLSGTVRLPAGDPVTLTIATNGREAYACEADPAVKVSLDKSPNPTGLVRLRIVAKENSVAPWRVRFGE